MTVAIAREAGERDASGRLQTPRDISAPGFEIPVAWASAPGATDVEVAQADLRIDTATAAETFPDVPVSNDGPHRVVTVPDGRSVSAIGLNVALLTGQRLTLALPSLRGGWEAPLFASAGVSNGAMAPASPEGASLSNGLFSLPRAVSAARLRLSVVTGDKITEFSPVAFTLSKVNLTTSTPPRNLRVLGPDGAAVWQAPALPAGSPPVHVDLKTPIEIAFRKQVAANARPAATITVAGDAPSRAFLSTLVVRGALLRVAPGISSITLDGIARPMPLPAPIAAERPSSVIADVTVRYDGMRILNEASDELPSGFAAAEGVIVGPSLAMHAFPPEALSGIAPARIGVPGRSLQGSEVSLEFVRMVGSSPGDALGPPAVLAVPASQQIDLHWANVPAGVSLAGPVGVRARANRGTFFWVANEEHPIVRLAIHDPDPASAPLMIGGDRIPVASGVVELPKHALAPAAFAGSAPVLASDLFLTVEIGDLTLRYAR